MDLALSAYVSTPAPARRRRGAASLHLGGAGVQATSPPPARPPAAQRIAARRALATALAEAPACEGTTWLRLHVYNGGALAAPLARFHADVLADALCQFASGCSARDWARGRCSSSLALLSSAAYAPLLPTLLAGLLEPVLSAGLARLVAACAREEAGVLCGAGALGLFLREGAPAGEAEAEAAALRADSAAAPRAAGGAMLVEGHMEEEEGAAGAEDVAEPDADAAEDEPGAPPLPDQRMLPRVLAWCACVALPCAAQLLLLGAAGAGGSASEGGGERGPLSAHPAPRCPLPLDAPDAAPRSVCTPLLPVHAVEAVRRGMHASQQPLEPLGEAGGPAAGSAQSSSEGPPAAGVPRRCDSSSACLPGLPRPRPAATLRALALALHACALRCVCRARCEGAFEALRDWPAPASRAAASDLRDAARALGPPAAAALAAALTGALHSRLLHAGVGTSTILELFLSAARMVSFIFFGSRSY